MKKLQKKAEAKLQTIEDTNADASKAKKFSPSTHNTLYSRTYKHNSEGKNTLIYSEQLLAFARHKDKQLVNFYDFLYGYR